MAFRNRLIVVGILAALAVMMYGATTYYSEELIYYVVEQALLQKLPRDTDPVLIRRQFRRQISALPTRQARLERLINLSQFLEKVQNLNQQELDQLLRKDSSSPRQDRSLNISELSPSQAV